MEIAPRFLLYSHDGVGLGHFRRNLVLAQALTEARPGTSVLLGCSADGAEAFTLPPGVDLLRMPGVRKVGDRHYESQQLHLDTPTVLRLRASLLAVAVEQFRPHVLLADKHPLGVGEELVAALDAQRALGGHAALGLRDVLDEPARTVAEWSADDLGRAVAERYARVLVYGSRGLLDPIATGMLPRQALRLVRYCGYVVGSVAAGPVPLDLPRTTGRPLVLATVGGGEDGGPVLEAFIEASRRQPWDAVVVGGPQMPDARWTAIEATAAAGGVRALRSVSLVQRWFASADAIVCMGGYNTLLEAVSSGTPTVCVPRIRPRREQLVRAQAFVARDLIQMVDPDALDGRELGAAISRALTISRDALASRAAVLDVQGAERAAGLLLDLAGGIHEPERRPASTAA